MAINVIQIAMTAHLVKLKALLQTYTLLDSTEINLYEIDHIKNAVDEIIQFFKWDLKEKLKESPQNYVPTLQCHLTYIADGGTAFDRRKPKAEQINEFARFLIEQVYDLIAHLQTYYPDSFDFDANMPSHYQDFLGLPCLNNLVSLEKSLEEKNVDDDLISILKDFFSATNETQRFQIRTWRQFQFRESLFTRITHALANLDGAGANLEILKIMIAYELNSIQVYSFFIKFIEKTALGNTDLEEQEQGLLYLVKLFRQVRVEVKSAFDPDAPSLKGAVLESLEAELTYIKQKNEAFLNKFKSAHPDGQNRFYFKVAMTLPELMFFFRILLEIGWMATRFNSYLYEFIAKHIQTERMDQLSKKSMRNHFSSKPFPDRIVKSVRAWLEKAINHIDTHYK